MSGQDERDRVAAQARAMRQQFLLDPELTFLNHGSFGACPKPVFEVYQQWQRELERNPVELLARRSAELLGQVRAALGALIGAPADCLVLVTNATVAANTVARSLGLRPRDEILMTDQEYGACEAMWELLCRHAGARVVRCPVELPFRPERFVEQLWAARTERTRLIHLSHVTSSTGIVFPVAAICELARSHAVLTLVDGAHAPGQL
jgi:isopenicillin-N epimerase